MKCIVVVLFLLFSLTSNATCSILEQAGNQQADGEYVVSGVLQLNGVTTIKLIHSIIKADNSSEALDKFTSIAIKEYPDYKLVTSVVSPRSALLMHAECVPSI